MALCPEDKCDGYNAICWILTRRLPLFQPTPSARSAGVSSSVEFKETNVASSLIPLRYQVMKPLEPFIKLIPQSS